MCLFLNKLIIQNPKQLLIYAKLYFLENVLKQNHDTLPFCGAFYLRTDDPSHSSSVHLPLLLF